MEWLPPLAAPAMEDNDSAALGSSDVADHRHLAADVMLHQQTLLRLRAVAKCHQGQTSAVDRRNAPALANPRHAHERSSDVSEETAVMVCRGHCDRQHVRRVSRTRVAVCRPGDRAMLASDYGLLQCHCRSDREGSCFHPSQDSGLTVLLSNFLFDVQERPETPSTCIARAG
eukprot:762759-Hanusia_phi.AAC.2